MFEGSDVLPDCRFKVLTLSEVNVLTPRIAQDIAEQFDSATSFLNEIDMVSRPVHLSLSTRSGFESNRCWLGFEPMRFDKVTNDRVLSIKAKVSKLL